jgi:hypothetical protein
MGHQTRRQDGLSGDKTRNHVLARRLETSVNTEKTSQGDQILTPETKPLTATRQAEIERGGKPKPRQKPMDVGLFDTDARNQKEMDL